LRPTLRGDQLDKYPEPRYPGTHRPSKRMALSDELDPAETPEDPYQWLEEITGERALEWVLQRNAASAETLGGSEALAALEERLLGILNSEERIASVGKHGPFYYNFWRDRSHERGIWRRTTLDEYRKDDPAWEIVLDLDALATKEGENWQWSGATWLEPDHTRCLVRLSRGGGDATVVREFDPERHGFVEDGFALDEAKTHVGWVDHDALYVGTDFGPGSLTRSGYPRMAKLWRRGTPLTQAETVYEASPDDVSVVAWRDHTEGFERDLVHRALTAYTNEVYLLRAGQLVKLDKPDDATIALHRQWLLLRLRSEYRVADRSYPAGALLAADFRAFLGGERSFEVLFEATDRTSLAGFSGTRNYLLLTVLDDVKSRVTVFRHGEDGFVLEPLPGIPGFATLSAWAIDPDHSDDYFLTATDYLTPPSLMLGTLGEVSPATLKRMPEFFSAEGLEVQQFEARSRDGTRVPYFQVSKRELRLDAANPTLLYGYGGFELSLVPGYDANVGAAWLEEGGVYVVANIRGGGEFGPKWHQAALKADRPRAYEDFIAVAEDLIARRVTSPPHLGAMGGSNGGLLMGNMLTLRPDLWSAIVCSMPLLDMRRYHTLLAGASWMGEYGNPDDPEEWRWIRGFSPYHNLRAATRYPPVLFLTSTRDDRVHPGHARKMAAKMLDLGIPDVVYYENIEGGHAGAANNRQAAHKAALAYTFLRQQLFPR
jgi:prolyl oligopeptidase